MKKLVVVLLILSVGTLSLFAQDRGIDSPKRTGRVEALSAQMSEAGFPLSEKQTEQLKELFEAQRVKMQEMRQNSKQDREAMKGSMQAMRKSTDSKVKYILSDEQMTVYQKIQSERPPRGGQYGKGGKGKVEGTDGVKPMPRGAKKGRGGAKKKAMQRLEKINTTLNDAGIPLTEFQNTKIKDLLSAQFSDLKNLRTQIKDNTAFKKEAKVIRKDYGKQIKAVLTKAQRKALKAIRGEK